jgi:hypothetical protein
MQNIKLWTPPEGNTEENLDDLGIDDKFLDRTLKVWSMEERTDKLDIKKLLHNKRNDL